MPFTALHAVHKDTGDLVLTLHLVPAAQEEQAAWEEVVAAATRELWNSSAGAGPAFAAAGHRTVLVDCTMADLALLLVGEGDTDEAELESALPVLLGILRGTCGSACSVDSVRDNSGKAFVALAEVFQGGQLVHDDVELVLKLAKMKPLS